MEDKELPTLFLKPLDKLTSATNFSHFVAEMSAYVANSIIVSEYTDTLLGAMKTAKETHQTQVVAGESDISLLVHPNGNVEKVVRLESYRVLEEEQLFSFYDASLLDSYEITYKNSKGWSGRETFGRHEQSKAFFKAVELIKQGQGDVVLYCLHINGKNAIETLEMKNAKREMGEGH